jgi:type VI secretion system protein ImpA
MATGPLIDVEALLAPIPGDNPAGQSVRYAGDYDELKALLPKPDRDALEAGGQAGQWPKLVQLASKKLRERSKDLMIAGWLTEGLVNQHGFAGLRDGLILIRRLLEEYWEGVYPLPDDGDWEVRAAPLHALLEKNAPLWIGEIPLAPAPIRDPETDEAVPVTYNLWHAIAVAQMADKKPLAPAMEEAMQSAPAEFLRQRYEDLQQAKEALAALREVLNAQFGEAAPGVTATSDALEKCQGRLAATLSRRGIALEASTAAEETEAEVSSEDVGPAVEAVPGNGAAAGPIRSREDALRRLNEVADFFRRTEPHSPVPYLIHRAIRWSRLSFEQLLVELVKDENARLEIVRTLGLGGEDGSEAQTSSYPE